MTDTPTRGRGASRSTTSTPWWRGRWVLPALLVVLVVVFILENRAPVSIRLLIPLVVMPQWAALTITLVLGILIGWLLRRRR